MFYKKWHLPANSVKYLNWPSFSYGHLPRTYPANLTTKMLYHVWFFKKSVSKKCFYLFFNLNFKKSEGARFLFLRSNECLNFVKGHFGEIYINVLKIIFQFVFNFSFSIIVKHHLYINLSYKTKEQTILHLSYLKKIL